MRNLSREASTSIGSLYHFFPDKQLVINSLMERHLTAVQSMVRDISQLPDAHWLSRSAHLVIKDLAEPVLRYASEHPDLVVLTNQRVYEHHSRRVDLREELNSLYSRVLSLRMPNCHPDDIAKYAHVLIQLPMGLIIEQVDIHFCRQMLLEEAPRALSSYLAAIEKTHAE